MIFLLFLKSKINLVTLRKFNSHLQYFIIDLGFTIKLQEINLIVYEEHKTEHEMRGRNRSEREARDENVPAIQAVFFILYTSL